MKTLLGIGLCLLVGCGGLENEPFRFGVIRGQLIGADEHALVAVVGRDDLVARPDTEGKFELRQVPLGTVELLVVTTQQKSKRISVDVKAASIAELGSIQSESSATLTVIADALGRQSVATATVTLVGTPFSLKVSQPRNSALFSVPDGCYEILVTVPGLGTANTNICLQPGGSLEVTLTLLFPDGSPGREGCSVTGCQGTLTCQADRNCR